MSRDRVIPRNRHPDLRGHETLQAFVALEQVYDLIDQGQQEVEAAAQNPICISGCGKCCERMTPVSSRLEAAYVLANMSFLPTYRDIRARIEQWLTDEYTEVTNNLEHDFQVLSHSPCPFLAESKLCTIYEFRPLACRTYGVTTSADPWCPRPLHHTETDSRRMIIERDTPLGQAIKTNIQVVVSYVKSKFPVFSHIGLLPGLIAQELIPDAKTLSTARAKLAYRESTVSPKLVEDARKVIIEQEVQPYDLASR